MRFNSKLITSVAYGVDVPDNEAGKTVTVVRGINEVSAEDLAFLHESPSFNRHGRAGMFTEIPPDAPAEPPAPPAPEAVDPRARKPKESEKAYNARMKLLDEEAAEADREAAANAEFFAAYDAMTPDEQAAMYGTLSAEEKALIDGRVKT